MTTNLSALESVLRDLQSTNPKEMAQRALAKWGENGQIFLKFFNENYAFTYPEGIIARSPESVNESIETVRILLLHYLIGAKDIPLSGKLIPFRNLSGAVSFEKAFSERAVEPVAKNFCSNPEGFRKAAENVGGKALEAGDLSYSIMIFPRIPIYYVLWLGDDEVQGSANILFDSTANQHLPTEDLAVLGELSTNRLLAAR
jgi:hypothetical protein